MGLVRALETSLDIGRDLLQDKVLAMVLHRAIRSFQLKPLELACARWRRVGEA